MQLANIDACANLAVKDINAAKKFYEDILELEPVSTTEGEELIVYKSGHSMINVYESRMVQGSRWKYSQYRQRVKVRIIESKE